MAQRVNQIVIGFIAPLFAGYWISKLDDGGEQIKSNVLSNLAGAVGMVIGYTLGRRKP